jgi:hypothetical protein
MAYSAKKRWTMTGSALALALAGSALLIWLRSNHANPVSLGLFRAALAVIVVGVGTAAQKQWFWGMVIGIAAVLPVVVYLQTNSSSLDAAVQFIFHRPAAPPLYFTLGVMLPVMFQVVSALVLRVADKLSQGPQS